MGLYPYYNGNFNGLLEGNFGYSDFYRTDVINVVKEPMKNTIFINVFATILALAITIPLGIRCAVKRGKLGDKTMQVLTIIGYSLPTVPYINYFYLDLLLASRLAAAIRNGYSRRSVYRNEVVP